jgi:hypothetical protein
VNHIRFEDWSFTLIFNIFSSNNYLRKVYRENNFLGLVGVRYAVGIKLSPKGTRYPTGTLRERVACFHEVVRLSRFGFWGIAMLRRSGLRPSRRQSQC